MKAPAGVQVYGATVCCCVLDCATTRGGSPLPARCTWPWLPSCVPHIQRLPSGLAANRPEPPRSPSSSTDPSWWMALSAVPERTKIREPAAASSSEPALTLSVCTTVPSGRSNCSVADRVSPGSRFDTTISTLAAAGDEAATPLELEDGPFAVLPPQAESNTAATNPIPANWGVRLIEIQSASFPSPSGGGPSYAPLSFS